MGQPSTQASNAIIYLSYSAFLYVQAMQQRASQNLIMPKFGSDTDYHKGIRLLYRMETETSVQGNFGSCWL